jgi:cation transport protein ChaC
MELPRWRGSPEQPGQMMVIERGGTCHGVAFRLPDEDRPEQLFRMLYRETEYRGDLDNTRWLNAETSGGRIRALAFWAAPTPGFPFLKLPPEETARRIARACGHVGSNAAYLYNTIVKLAEYGIHDRNLWRLQELVAEEIKTLQGMNGQAVL